MAERNFFLITCEHGGNRVPLPYLDLFRGQDAVLWSHRGFDAGALQMARELAAALGAPLLASTVTRLLIDLNRSQGHPRLYSEMTRNAPPALRGQILEDHYLPYREEAAAAIERAIATGARVIHISSHSFTPELDGTPRNADVGLLYDPARPGEVELSRRWREAIRHASPALKVRMNYPYAGTADGMTTALRRRFPAGRYVGLELEINQKHALAPAAEWRRLRQAVIGGLLEAAGRAGRTAARSSQQVAGRR
ncbi:N-formylglutamate amidohydrolase [Noviherbaspirillum massiliense]|uniref:N-formylglutamate amidohydrolase n=1 Tax=Noviherbaspirillum massiliense TaxID=1465823 RepID=UPI0002DC4246|nr:N-formylglutamate amidohydrolase [Noviherbaspirillum massiliense]